MIKEVPEAENSFLCRHKNNWAKESCFSTFLSVMPLRFAHSLPTISNPNFWGIVQCNHKITLEIRFNCHSHLSNTFQEVILKSLTRRDIAIKIIACNNDIKRKTNCFIGFTGA